MKYADIYNNYNLDLYLFAFFRLYLVSIDIIHFFPFFVVIIYNILSNSLLFFGFACSWNQFIFI